MTAGWLARSTYPNLQMDCLYQNRFSLAQIGLGKEEQGMAWRSIKLLRPVLMQICIDYRKKSGQFLLACSTVEQSLFHSRLVL